MDKTYTRVDIQLFAGASGGPILEHRLADIPRDAAEHFMREIAANRKNPNTNRGILVGVYVEGEGIFREFLVNPHNVQLVALNWKREDAKPRLMGSAIEADQCCDTCEPKTETPKKN